MPHIIVPYNLNDDVNGFLANTNSKFPFQVQLQGGGICYFKTLEHFYQIAKLATGENTGVNGETRNKQQALNEILVAKDGEIQRKAWNNNKDFKKKEEENFNTIESISSNLPAELMVQMMMMKITQNRALYDSLMALINQNDGIDNIEFVENCPRGASNSSIGQNNMLTKSDYECRDHYWGCIYDFQANKIASTKYKIKDNDGNATTSPDSKQGKNLQGKCLKEALRRIKERPHATPDNPIKQFYDYNQNQNPAINQKLLEVNNFLNTNQNRFTNPNPPAAGSAEIKFVNVKNNPRKFENLAIATHAAPPAAAAAVPMPARPAAAPIASAASAAAAPMPTRPAGAAVAAAAAAATIATATPTAAIAATPAAAAVKPAPITAARPIQPLQPVPQQVVTTPAQQPTQRQPQTAAQQAQPLQPQPQPQAVAQQAQPQPQPQPAAPNQAVQNPQAIPIATAAVIKQIADNINTQNQKDFCAEFIKKLSDPNVDIQTFENPSCYCGIGAKTESVYNQKKGGFGFKIIQIFDNSVAQKLGLTTGDEIFCATNDNSENSLKEAINKIRSLDFQDLKLIRNSRETELEPQLTKLQPTEKIPSLIANQGIVRDVASFRQQVAANQQRARQ